MRFAQMHDCPATRRNLMPTAPSAAAARPASSKTMNGALPPSSKDTRFSWSLAPAMSRLPTSVDPVKAILRTAGCSRNVRPTTPALLLVTTLNTPPGKPAAVRACPVARAAYNQPRGREGRGTLPGDGNPPGRPGQGARPARGQREVLGAEPRRLLRRGETRDAGDGAGGPAGGRGPRRTRALPRRRTRGF